MGVRCVCLSSRMERIMYAIRTTFAATMAVIAAKVEADELLDSATESAGVRIVTHIFDNRDANSLKRLAVAIVANPDAIAAADPPKPPPVV